MACAHEVLLDVFVPYLCQISASAPAWFYEVQAFDSPASNPGQLVSCTCSMPCQLPRSTSLHLQRVVVIDNLGKYVDLPQIYCDALSSYPDPGVVLRLNFLPAVVFRLVLNYSMLVECLFFDHFAGLSVVESLLELHQASQFLVNLYHDEMVQGLYLNLLFFGFGIWCG